MTIDNILLKYQPQHEIKTLNYLTDHVLYQEFKTILDSWGKDS